jgi:hypothetical protein
VLFLAFNPTLFCEGELQEIKIAQLKITAQFNFNENFILR